MQFENARKHAGDDSAPLGAIEGWPVSGAITTLFGVVDKLHPAPRGHSGLDIAAAEGAPVYAPIAAQVREVFCVDLPSADDAIAYDKSQFGNSVILEAEGIVIRLAHLRDAALVTEGQHIAAGTLIGYVGSTGFAVGPHMHIGAALVSECARPAGGPWSLLDPLALFADAFTPPAVGSEAWIAILEAEGYTEAEPEIGSPEWIALAEAAGLTQEPAAVTVERSRKGRQILADPEGARAAGSSAGGRAA